MPLLIRSPEHFATVKRFARSLGGKARQSLIDSLKTLCEYGPDTRCVLYWHFAPYSLAFHIESRRPSGEYEFLFNGGLLYHGTESVNGKTPALCIGPKRCREPQWVIHEPRWEPRT